MNQSIYIINNYGVQIFIQNYSFGPVVICMIQHIVNSNIILSFLSVSLLLGQFFKIKPSINLSFHLKLFKIKLYPLLKQIYCIQYSLLGNGCTTCDPQSTNCKSNQPQVVLQLNTQRPYKCMDILISTFCNELSQW